VTNINIAFMNSPAFARLQSDQLAALAPYPEARAAVVKVWRQLDAEMAAASPPLIEGRANVG
jgi:hypothetical protein